MMFRTHLALGILASIISLSYIDREISLLFAGTVILASVLPDIDLSNSTPGKKIKPLSWMIGLLFGHRGLVHTIFPPVIAYLAALGLGYAYLGSAFMIGYSTHLASDALTIQGIMPLFPLSRKRITGFIKTGGMIEHALFFSALALTIKTIL